MPPAPDDDVMPMRTMSTTVPPPAPDDGVMPGRAMSATVPPPAPVDNIVRSGSAPVQSTP